jgi:hypothetical protein
VRTLAIIYSPMERKMVERLAEKHERPQHSEEQMKTRSPAGLFQFTENRG